MSSRYLKLFVQHQNIEKLSKGVKIMGSDDLRTRYFNAVVNRDSMVFHIRIGLYSYDAVCDNVLFLLKQFQHLRL